MVFFEFFVEFFVEFFGARFTMTEAIELFPKDTWVSRPDNEHREATEHLKAALMAARSGNDDSIKQVRFLFVLFVFSSFNGPCVHNVF